MSGNAARMTSGEGRAVCRKFFKELHWEGAVEVSVPLWLAVAVVVDCFVPPAASAAVPTAAVSAAAPGVGAAPALAFAAALALAFAAAFDAAAAASAGAACKNSQART